ncbi:MAG: dienelactone hydrolase family protein [Acidobacteria bacterium]|nr:dienelactone hydrolase family protein [Acidobacteriota bacterium]
MLRTFLIAAAIFSFAPAASRAAGRAECRTMQSRILGRSVRYCVILPPSYDAEKTRRYPVLYHLHGLGDNERSLLRFGGWEMVEQLQESRRIGELLIVAPDGGRGFFLNSRDGGERYEDFFTEEFIPAIERRYRALDNRAGRGITGFSMGGYGALRLAFLHPQLFGSVSAHSAALFDDMPAEVAESLGGSSRPFGKPFDPGFWRQNTPLTLARKASDLKSLKIYFDCGRQDDYGFDAGAQALHTALEKRGIPHEFHLYPGNHSWLYVAEHFDESLEFHWRAFGAQM